VKRLRLVFEKYLSQIGRLEPIKLGSGGKRPIKKEDSEFFMRILLQELRFNKNLIILYVSLLFALFGISIFFVFYHFTSHETGGIIFSGYFLSILIIVDRLRRLWHEKSVMDMVLIVVKELPPQEIVRVIETLYWNSIRK